MMKLRYSPTSPYVRKVLALAKETGLEKRIELVLTNAWDKASDIVTVNPLRKVPCLVTEGGEVIYDSPVICAYLDSLHEGRKWIPPQGGERWTALRREALGDGILDAAVAHRMVTTQQPKEKWPEAHLERQMGTMISALDALEEEAPALAKGETNIGHLAIAAALGYLSFRFADLAWEKGRPNLARWYGEIMKRPSLQETMPKG